MKILMAQINTHVGHLQNNTKKIIDTINIGREKGIDLVVFPELTTTGYPPKDLLDHNGFINDNLKSLDQIISASDGIGCIVGFVHREDNKIFNAVALIYDRSIIGIQRKTLLPNYNVFDEKRHFTPAISREVFEFKGVKLGIQICEDLWDHEYKTKVTDELKAKGAELIINCSASPFRYSKRYVRFSLIKEKAIKNQVAFLYVNLIGGQDELIFDGESVAVNPDGSEVVCAKKFEEDFIELTFKEDTKEFGIIQNFPSYAPIREIKDALVLGTKDYCSKNGFKGALLGLSGGLDSAVTAALAVEALGKDNVLGILMPSKYSSNHSITDSIELAKNLGMATETIAIEPAQSAYINITKKIITKGHGKINPSEDFRSDATEQNFQARIRGNILMAFSNDYGYIVLSTGNKSENAVGYSTLYGDMAGGLNVIGDVFKTKVYDLADYINNTRIIVPINTITKAPSAELKPGQFDQNELPPYDVLDGILRYFIEEDFTIEEIASRGYQEKIVRSIIQKVNRNEYKRRQAAISLIISAKDLKNGRRMPIVNGYNY